MAWGGGCSPVLKDSTSEKNRNLGENRREVRAHYDQESADL